MQKKKKKKKKKGKKKGMHPILLHRSSFILCHLIVYLVQHHRQLEKP